jgi:transcription elongation factor Elf1
MSTEPESNPTTTGEQDLTIEEIAELRTTTGKWTHEKLQGLLQISNEDRYVADSAFENTLDEINAALADERLRYTEELQNAELIRIGEIDQLIAEHRDRESVRNIELREELAAVKDELRTERAKYHGDDYDDMDAARNRILDLEHQLAAEREKVERCEVCNNELSQCGVQGVDGEPSLDCLVCKLREQLDAERALHSETLDILADCQKQYRERCQHLQITVTALKPFAKLAAELLTNRKQIGVSTEDDLINAASALAKIGEPWV